MNLPASSTFPREPGAVPAARAFVRSSLGDLALSDDALDRLVLAAAEAFNNVIFHAKGDEFSVRVSCDRSSCTVGVTDLGAGFLNSGDRPPMPPASEVGRRGLALMYALVDQVDVRSSTAGTAVELVQGLSSNGASWAALADADG